MRVAMDIAGYEDLRKEQEEKRARGELMGIGVSFFTEGVGAGPRKHMDILGLSMNDGADLRVHPSGKAVVSASAPRPRARATRRRSRRSSPRSSGIPPEDVEVRHGDTDKSPYGLGTYGVALDAGVRRRGRGRVAQGARQGPRDRGADARDAARGPRVGEGPLVRQGRPASRARSIFDIAERAYSGESLPEGMEGGLDAQVIYDPPNLTYPYGAYIAVVDVDPETAHVKVRRFIAVDDCGVRINPMIVDGQIHGGLAEGVGIALMEVITFDEEGNCLNGSFMDYLIPTALECPDFELGETVTPCPHHPLGAKGVGESPNVGSPPAIVNAVIDALHETPRRRPHRHAVHAGPRVGRDAGARRAAAVNPTDAAASRHLAPDVETLARRLAAVDYLVDEGLATALFLSLRLPQPLLLEGEAGVGKTEAAQGARAVLDTPLIRLQCYDGIDAAEALYEWNYPRQLLAIRLAEANGEPLSEEDLFGRDYLIARPLLRALRAPRAAAGGAADRRDRPRRRRLRGLPARAARRGRGDDPRARHDPRHAPAGDRAHLQPHARPARRGQAPLPVPVDRLPGRASASSTSCAGACRARRSRSPSRSWRRWRRCATATSRSRRGSPRRSTGWRRSSCSA